MADRASEIDEDGVVVTVIVVRGSGESCAVFVTVMVRYVVLV